MMLADFDPGGLTTYFIMMVGSFLIGVCLVSSVIMFVVRNTEIAKTLLKAAGIFFAAGFVLIILARVFGPSLHLL